MPRLPPRRIVFAAAFSVLLHAMLLWLPNITLPRFETPLPQLTAKLIPLPKLPHKIARPRPNHPKPAASTLSDTPQAPSPAEALPPKADAATSGVPATPLVAASAVAPVAALSAQSSPVAAVDYTLTSDNAPELPRHARLRFSAHLGEHGLSVGEIRHELEIGDGHYSLHSESETTGLAHLIKRFQLIQDSRGTLSQSGSLQPDKFTEEKTDGHGTQRAEASFDWPAQQINFAQGGKAALPLGAQDILSFLYQLSQLPFDREIIPLAISNGKKLESYRLEVGAEENIITPMGVLHTLHLRKMHGPNEEGLEVWLGMEYRLLPVKFRHIERNGEVSGEMVIKEIRVSDE